MRTQACLRGAKNKALTSITNVLKIHSNKSVSFADENINVFVAKKTKSL